MRREYAQFQGLECEILNVGPDSLAQFKAYWMKHQLPFPGLADPETRVAKLYRQPVRLLKLGRMPMQLIIDREGVICDRYESNSMSDIPPIDTVLQKLAKLT